MEVTTVTPAESPYDILPEDGFIIVSSVASPIVLNLPDPANLAGSFYVVKDGSGNCSPTSSITVNPPGGSLIDKGASLVIDSSSAAVSIVTDGTEWYVF